MQLEEQTLPAPEAGHRDEGMGIAQALSLLLLGLLVDLVTRILLLACGFRFYSAPSMVVPQVLMWAFLLWFGVKMGGSVRRLATASVSPRLLAPVIVASLGAAIVLPQIAGLLPMPDRLVESMRKLKEIGSLPLALSLGLIAPVAEETFFRGIVLRGFLARYSVRKAIWASAILFATVHLNPWQAIIALPMGGAYAYMVIRTGSIWPGIVSHAVVNLAHNFLTPSMLTWLGYTPDDIEKLTFLPYPMLVFGVAALVTGGIWLKRELDRQSGPGTAPVTS
ncbi:MAG TPA: CPBP family intramembrane glutamic endopeptidase [Candidatus Krumholzibacteria bacterium]